MPSEEEIIYIDMPRQNGRFRDFNLKLQTLALVMFIGTLNGYMLHAVASAPGGGGVFADMLFATATKVESLFMMDSGSTLALLPALIAIGLAISVIAVNGKRDA